MKLILPEEKAIQRKQWIIYISIITICIICVITAFYVQFYARIDFSRWMGFEPEDQLGKKTEEEIQLLKIEFDQLFVNHIENGEGNDSKKKESDKPLVYTKMERKESKENDYDMEVHIPCINIDHETIESYNQEIEEFVHKTNDVLASKDKNTIYTVDYIANVKDDILSLMIRSNLKEGFSAQRVIIQTYNYDLRNNKPITLQEVLKIENVNLEDTQKKIKDTIESEQKKVEDLKNLGYNVHSRDITKDIYTIDDTTQFYLTNNALYIIYAYGNETFTSEMDLIIL